MLKVCIVTIVLLCKKKVLNVQSAAVLSNKNKKNQLQFGPHHVEHPQADDMLAEASKVVLAL